MKHADDAPDQQEEHQGDTKKQTWRQRWKKTSIANKALVITGALVAFSSLVYTVTTIFLVVITYLNIQETSRQTDRLIAASDRLAKTTADALEETKRSNTETA